MPSHSNPPPPGYCPAQHGRLHPPSLRRQMRRHRAWPAPNSLPADVPVVGFATPGSHPQPVSYPITVAVLARKLILCDPTPTSTPASQQQQPPPMPLPAEIAAGTAVFGASVTAEWHTHRR
ncbi:hypothetical protein K458DRAFT_403803 [Lentithecium fluviatile CBS 122367]|uniref:Uncharacterized protein n=1 Tax=Lentithecium fluviatile CBS 122367 TaxID=1168545 RepID=A0A6G1J3R4_9PLEO|nr:hypothetical protein K458DRAFT_403803 [Lentithecium fluviatile CBS 122367]